MANGRAAVLMAVIWLTLACSGGREALDGGGGRGADGLHADSTGEEGRGQVPVDGIPSDERLPRELDLGPAADDGDQPTLPDLHEGLTENDMLPDQQAGPDDLPDDLPADHAGDDGGPPDCECDLDKLTLTIANPQAFEFYELCIPPDLQPDMLAALKLIDDSLYCSVGGVFAGCPKLGLTGCHGELEYLPGSKELTEAKWQQLCKLSCQPSVATIGGGHYVD